MGEMSRAEKIVASVFCLTAMLWIFRRPIVIGESIVPGWSNLFKNPKFLHDSTVAMAMGILLLVFPVNGFQGFILNGRTEWFALDWKTVQSKTPWGILILFGGNFLNRTDFQHRNDNDDSSHTRYGGGCCNDSPVVLYGASNACSFICFHAACSDTIQCNCFWQWLGEHSENVESRLDPPPDKGD